MEFPQPLRVHIGEQELVLFNGGVVGFLQRFSLYYEPGILTTQYDCAGCYPSVHKIVPPDALSHTQYPLRIYAGPREDRQEVDVYLHGRPLSRLKSIKLLLSSDQKRQVQIVFTHDYPQEVVDALVTLGVEVIVDHEETDVQDR
jgi:hypothetical protein